VCADEGAGRKPPSGSKRLREVHRVDPEILRQLSESRWLLELVRKPFLRAHEPGRCAWSPERRRGGHEQLCAAEQLRARLLSLLEGTRDRLPVPRQLRPYERINGVEPGGTRVIRLELHE
jgi:hypothetical protein